MLRPDVARVLAATVCVAAACGAPGTPSHLVAALSPEAKAARCDSLRRAARDQSTFEVEPARPLGANAAPEFPDQADLPERATVIAQFVVDTAGAVEPGTVQLAPGTPAAAPPFLDAVRQAALGWHFRPAELAPGCPINFLFKQRFEFRR